jgi:hypothetical protein
MKAWIGITAVALTSAVVVAQGRPKAEVTPLVGSDGVHAGSTVQVALQVSLPDGLHVQSDKPRDPLLIPTVLTIEPPAGVTLGEIAYPESTDFAQAGQKEPLAVFAQRFVIGAKLVLDGSLPPGDIVVPARFRYQACDASTCFAPAREEARWTMRIVPAATPTPARSSEIFEKIRFRR